MLDDLELPNVQEISTYDRRMLAEHKPPGMEGSLFQNMGRRPQRIGLWGLALGPEALQFMQKLNDIFQAGKPVSFCADIVARSNLDLVLIEDLQWGELAGKPEQAGYILTLREFISPVEPATVEPLQPVVPVPPVIEIIENIGTLIVEVVVEGRQDFDYGLVTVSVQGEQDDGTTLCRTLTNHSANIWTEEDFPAGNYAVKAETTDPEAMTGTAEARVSAGQTVQASITLHPAPSNIAKTFVVHFKMDNAFIEPAMADVLKRVADYGKKHPQEKLIILGHTDLVGSDEYNQNLSERRARSAYAFLTFGRDKTSREEAVKEWDTLRRQKTGEKQEIRDGWGTREYQFMLQNLSHCYYYGNIDGVHGPKTSAAVSAFQKDNGIIPPTGMMTDETWEALIEKYLGRIPLAVPEIQFFRNAGDGCEGGPLKWLGAGEQDPVRNTQDAWRPNRRTELLFVQGECIPCDVPKPRTFDKLVPGTPWCLGTDENSNPEASIKRQDFLRRTEEEPGKWLVQPAEPGRIRIVGTITKETDDGPGVPNAKYVLTAPDGEYLHTDAKGDPDLGERPQGERRGQPIPNQADENGAFSYPKETPAGNYTLEILDLKEPALSRWKMDDNWMAKGNISFKQITELLAKSGSQSSIAEASTDVAREEQSKKETKIGAVQQPKAIPPPPANPQIIISGHPIVVVRRGSYVNPDRREIRLKTDNDIGEWLLTKNIDQVHLFRNKGDTDEIVYDGQSNKFAGAELCPDGKIIYAEATDCTNIDECELRLAPATGSSPLASKKITAVRLTLDLPSLDQPPEKPPASGQAKDKWYKGGILFAQDSSYSQKRVKLIAKVEPDNLLANPNKYAGLDYILRQVLINGNNIGEMHPGNEKAKIFATEIHIDNEKEIINPHNFIDINDQFFVEGWKKSNARGFGYQLGIKLEDNKYEYDGDRVALTVANFPRLVVGLNKENVKYPLVNNKLNSDQDILNLLDYIYRRLKTPNVVDGQVVRPDALAEAWSSQGAESLPINPETGQEITIAEEAWARQVSEMLTLTAYAGPGQFYLGDGNKDSIFLIDRIAKRKDDKTGSIIVSADPAYALTYACEHLASFGVGTRAREKHLFKKRLLGAGSSTAGTVRLMDGAWICKTNNEPADPVKLDCLNDYRRSNGLFKIKDNFSGFEFAPGSVFVFSNRRVKLDGARTANTITKIDGNKELTYALKNGDMEGTPLEICLFNTNTDLLLDNSGGAHIGFVLRADPYCKLFQVFDTGALRVQNRQDMITLFSNSDQKDWQTGNYDDPCCSEVSGNDPFRGVGVWKLMEKDSDALEMERHVNDILKKARPLGFARLIVAKKTPEITISNYVDFVNNGNLIYASPLLRMYENDPIQNFAISRYIWSLRGISKEDAKVIWWIYIPKKQLSQAMLESPRDTDLNALANKSIEYERDSAIKNKLSGSQMTAKILAQYTFPILEFQVPNESGTDSVLITYRYHSKRTVSKGESSLHRAERSDNNGSILLPMDREFPKNISPHGSYFRA
jgi:outer membrane protein OmpA-like peptidoglycan-associated protein